MFRFLRQHRFFRLFWGFMAFYLLNISVDAPDVSRPGMAENLAYNEMESVVEFFLEDLLCIADAVPEHDDPDRDDDSEAFAKKRPDFFFDFTFSLISCTIVPTERRLLSGTAGAMYLNFWPAILTPPPEF